MDDYIAAVTVAVAAYYRRCKQRIENINQLVLILRLLDEEDAIVCQEHILYRILLR